MQRKSFSQPDAVISMDADLFQHIFIFQLYKMVAKSLWCSTALLSKKKKIYTQMFLLSIRIQISL